MWIALSPPTLGLLTRRFCSILERRARAASGIARLRLHQRTMRVRHGHQDEILPPDKVGRTDAVEIAGADFEGRDPLPRLRRSRRGVERQWFRTGPPSPGSKFAASHTFANANWHWSRHREHGSDARDTIGDIRKPGGDAAGNGSAVPARSVSPVAASSGNTTSPSRAPSPPTKHASISAALELVDRARVSGLTCPTHGRYGPLRTSILSSALLQRCQHQFEPTCSKSSRGIVAWSTLLPGDLPRGDLRGAASSEAGARRRQRDRGGVLRAGAVRKRSSSTIASASRARRSCLACSMPGGRRFALSRASRAISSNRSPNDIVCLTRRRRFF